MPVSTIVVRYAFYAVLLIVDVSQVLGHGRMLEPPARNTLWRFGFKAPVNYNDNELFCGGIGVSCRWDSKYSLSLRPLPHSLPPL